MIFLRYPRIEDEDSFQKAESFDWGEFSFAHYFESIAKNNFKTYVEILPGFAKGKNLPQNHVPCTFLFAYNEDGEIVGRTSIRHRLNSSLLKTGGHIGYGVVPSFREKGYATAILKETLSYIKEKIPELEKVLLTCDENNVGSRKTIERNGGVLENIILDENGGKIMRFWIQI